MGLFLESALEYKLHLEMSIRWFVFFFLEESFFSVTHLKIRFVYHQYVNSNAFLLTAKTLWLILVHMAFSLRGNVIRFYLKILMIKNAYVSSIWVKKKFTIR